MVRLIMGEKGTGKTKKLIEMINTTAQEDNGSVVCVEAKSTMTFDLHYHVRLISAYEYDLSNYEALRGFLFGLYAGNYDISHIFIDNLFKITERARALQQRHRRQVHHLRLRRPRPCHRRHAEVSVNFTFAKIRRTPRKRRSFFFAEAFLKLCLKMREWQKFLL